MGVTGLEVVGKDGEALPVKLSMLTANPKDLHSLSGHERDDRTLDKYASLLLCLSLIRSVNFAKFHL